MADQPGQPGATEDNWRHRAAVALRSMGHPNSIARAYDFWDDRYWWRRLFSQVLGTFFLVLVAVGAGMVNATAPPSAPCKPIAGDSQGEQAAAAPGDVRMATIRNR